VIGLNVCNCVESSKMVGSHNDGAMRVQTEVRKSLVVKDSKCFNVNEF
jgi:hypothetical protein